MCREMDVTGITFISCLEFHTKPRLEYSIVLSSREIRFCLFKSIFLISPQISNRPFATQILSFTTMTVTMAGSTTHCGHHFVFARLRIFQALRFGSHVHSLLDLPFRFSWGLKSTRNTFRGCRCTFTSFFPDNISRNSYILSEFVCCKIIIENRTKPQLTLPFLALAKVP